MSLVPGSEAPLAGWGLPLGVSYPLLASSRPGMSTEMDRHTESMELLMVLAVVRIAVGTDQLRECDSDQDHHHTPGETHHHSVLASLLRLLSKQRSNFK